MSVSTLKLFCAWNSLRQLLRRAVGGKKSAVNSSQPKCQSRRKTKRVFFEMP
jgi:hypothetical protein